MQVLLLRVSIDCCDTKPALLGPGVLFLEVWSQQGLLLASTPVLLLPSHGHAGHSTESLQAELEALVCEDSVAAGFLSLSSSMQALLLDVGHVLHSAHAGAAAGTEALTAQVCREAGRCHLLHAACELPLMACVPMSCLCTGVP